MHSLIIFDLDDTLAESKSAITPEMADTLSRLLSRTKVAIITGGKYEQIMKQVVGNLPASATLENLYLFPTCGASYYRYTDGVWSNVYEERLDSVQVERIFAALRLAQERAHVITE